MSSKKYFNAENILKCCTDNSKNVCHVFFFCLYRLRLDSDVTGQQKSVGRIK